MPPAAKPSTPGGHHGRGLPLSLIGSLVSTGSQVVDAHICVGSGCLASQSAGTARPIYADIPPRSSL